MKRISLAILAILVWLLAFSARASEVRGVWTATSRDTATLQFEISVGDHNRHSQPQAIAAFAGLSKGQINATGETPVRFRMEREAGTFAFEGSFKQREGAGHFVFTPSPGYLDSLRSLGVDTTDLTSKEHPDEALISYAILDVSTGYIRSLQAEGYREAAVKSYLEFRIFRVTPELIRDLRVLGYADLPAKQIVEMQIHGASPQFIRELSAEGYANVPQHDLIQLRIFHVTPDKIREYRQLGYDHLTPKQLVEMSIHRVTPQFIREMSDAGYSGVPVNKLVELRIHGIDAKMAKRMNGEK